MVVVAICYCSVMLKKKLSFAISIFLSHIAREFHTEHWLIFWYFLCYIYRKCAREWACMCLLCVCVCVRIINLVNIDDDTFIRLNECCAFYLHNFGGARFQTHLSLYACIILQNILRRRRRDASGKARRYTLSYINMKVCVRFFCCSKTNGSRYSFALESI